MSESDSTLHQLIDSYQQLDKGQNLAITSEVATGGMGKVYAAYDQSIRRHVAMKVLKDELNMSEEAAVQFVEEVQITGQLEHPNIVPVHQLGMDEKNNLFFTMKLVEGESLKQVIDALKDRVTEYEDYYNQFMMLTIFRKVCDAISFAHSKGIVHRDLKPENIMVGEYGEVLVMDWGIAKHIGDEEITGISSQRVSQAGGLLDTLAGMVKGSPAYMSPEQAFGYEYDERSDVFLLGSTLYHMLCLEPPYMGEDVNILLDKAEKGEFLHPHEIAPDKQIPDALCNIILKTMAKNKGDRYQNVDELIHALDAFMSGQIISEKKTFQEGENIISHGEMGSEAYLIMEGEVEIYKKIHGRKTVLAKLGRGDIFGELAALTSEKRSASVSALEETTCMIINEQTIDSQLEKLPPWFSRVLNSLLNRLKKQEEMLHPLLVSDCTFEVLNQMRMIYLCDGYINEEGLMEYRFKDLVSEIAINLKIPESHVRPVIAGLTENGFGILDANLNLALPNWNLFCDFIEYSRNTPSNHSLTMTSAISEFSISKLYTDGRSLVYRHAKVKTNEKLPPLGALKPVKDTVKGEQSVAIRNNFQKTLEELQSYSDVSKSATGSYFKETTRHNFDPSNPPKISTNFNFPGKNE